MKWKWLQMLESSTILHWPTMWRVRRREVIILVLSHLARDFITNGQWTEVTLHHSQIIGQTENIELHICKHSVVWNFIWNTGGGNCFVRKWLWVRQWHVSWNLFYPDFEKGDKKAKRSYKYFLGFMYPTTNHVFDCKESTDIKFFSKFGFLTV